MSRFRTTLTVKVTHPPSEEEVQAVKEYLQEYYHLKKVVIEPSRPEASPYWDISAEMASSGPSSATTSISGKFRVALHDHWGNTKPWKSVEIHTKLIEE